MASSYFTLPSFARAKKNTEELEKTNPQKPVLNEDDEKFLERHLSQDHSSNLNEVQPTIITDEGLEKDASTKDQEEAKVSSDQVALPETQPEAETVPKDEPKAEEDAQAEKHESHGEQVETKAVTTGEAPESNSEKETEDPPEQVPDDTKYETAPKSTKPKKDKGFELPSQEEAEAATAGWGVGSMSSEKSQGEKRTWASYLPSMPAKKDTASGSTETAAQTAQRTWTEYASAYAPTSLPNMPSMPAMPNMPSLPALFSKDKDSRVEPVYKEDGTIDEAATKEKQEKEVSVLLDNLNLSSINNRVFAFSAETQKIYERFALVLRDTMNGAPTAYDDMEKLMKDAGPQLEKQFKSMPPFVQTLVKSLPAKLGTTLGPELLAAASEKPGADMKTRLAAANKSSSGTASPAAPEAGQKGKKKKIPGLKGLVSSQGAVAGLLRNAVTFLQTRFPFLASATNVVMSLAVFILMLTFWYCHKRGKETRLAREGEGSSSAVDGAGEKIDGEDDDMEVDASDEDSELAKSEILNRPHPKEIPLPSETEEEKKAVDGAAE